jgi:thioester reductase-like protein
MGYPESRTLFVTGATGFVGAALVLRLLRDNPQDRAFCLVRAADAEAAQGRLVVALERAAAAYGVGEAAARAVCEQVVAVPGDLTAPHLGISVRDRERMATAAPLTVWHAAASLKDDEPNLREIIAHNVTGTERLLETVLGLNVAVFNHVSTAYVAGRQQGVVTETLERPRGFNNRYEQTKYYGEMLVVDHCRRARVPYRILRPAIVIGHSGTGMATGYTGFMGWILKVAALAEQSGGALQTRSLRYAGVAEAEVNVIPIDSIVEDCAGIDTAGAATHDQVFHLTNRAAPTMRWLCDITARTLGIARIEIVDDAAELDPISQKFQRWTRFERPYTRGRKRFDRGSNAGYASPRHGACPLSPDLMERMIRLAVHDMRQQLARRKEVA